MFSPYRNKSDNSKYIINEVADLTINDIRNNIINKVVNLKINNVGNNVINKVENLTINNIGNNSNKATTSDIQVQFLSNPDIIYHQKIMRSRVISMIQD